MTASQTPFLDSYSTDLTARARRGLLPPLVGRANEVERVIQVLSRRGKRNPVLLGDSGSGCTSTVHLLSQRLAAGQVPDLLRSSRLLAIDLLALGAQGDHQLYRSRMEAIFNEARQGQAILVFDRVHLLVSGQGGCDLSPLYRGQIHCIGICTLSEYRTHVEKVPGLERRFQQIIVNPPAEGDMGEILRAHGQHLGAHFRVRIDDKALLAVLDLSDRYLSGACSQPQKALALLTRACSARAGATLDENALCAVLENLLGEPVLPWSRLAERLPQLEADLLLSLPGEEETVRTAIAHLQQALAGPASPNRPLACFLLVGSAAASQTLARTLAGSLFAAQELTFDPRPVPSVVVPGRICGCGCNGPFGQILETVRRKPHQVLLLTDVEQGDQDLLAPLLLIAAEGKDVTCVGQRVSFSRTILLAATREPGQARQRLPAPFLQQAVELTWQG